MIRHSFLKLITTALIVVLLTGFASCPGKATIPPLASITTVENAERALVIAQTIRVEQRNHLARRVALDGQIDTAEADALAAFDRLDARFTAAWSECDRSVQLWKSIAGGQGGLPTTFTEAYRMLYGIVMSWQGDALEIRPIANPGGAR